MIKDRPVRWNGALARELISKHGVPARRAFTRRLVLDHVPVLDHHTVPEAFRRNQILAIEQGCEAFEDGGLVLGGVREVIVGILL